MNVQIMTVVRDRLLGVPAACAPRAAHQPAALVREVVDELIRDALTELSKLEIVTTLVDTAAAQPADEDEIEDDDAER